MIHVGRREAGKLEIVCKEEIKQELVKKLLAHWYYTHAEKKFNSIAIEAYSRFKEYDFKMPTIEIRRMTKRWGSFNTTDKIILNPEIIKASSKCIEYVLVHEMCHLVVANHNKEFFRTLDTIVPSWKKWNNKLENKLS